MKRYAVCGVSTRAISMYIRPLVDDFAKVAQLVALLDCDPKRFETCRAEVTGLPEVATFLESQFDEMVRQTQPHAIIVAGVDHSHADYVIAALGKGLDVIVEKPMTTTAADAQRIIDAEAASAGSVQVAMNYRYPPVHRKIKQMILDGKVGQITSVNLDWTLDTHHGAGYFRRWHRTRANSGGLSIHKGSHHFDLLNWWLGQDPVDVFAFGKLNYFGPEGPMNPSRRDGRTCNTCTEREQCAYEMQWWPSKEDKSDQEKQDQLAFRNNKHAGYGNYNPLSCIFDSEVDIEDTYVANIRYDGGAMVSYSCTFSCPYEGYRLAINGTKGRIETQEYHAPVRIDFPIPAQQSIDFFPLFGGGKETIEVIPGEGGHGGGDPLIRRDMFVGLNPDRPFDILANAKTGAMSVAVGEAIHRSVTTGQPQRIADLLGEQPSPQNPAKAKPSSFRKRPTSAAARA